MIKEEIEYRFYTKPAELHKAINTLRGIVSGISADGQISDVEIQELIHWCDLHRFLDNRHPFSEIIPLIDNAISDDIITQDEIQDIIWVCNNIVSEGAYYNALTSGIQQLQGLLHGILADNVITDREIKNLYNWLIENDFLKTSYPYDEIESLLTTVLADGKVTEDERTLLKAFFAAFVDMKNSYNINEVEINELRKSFNISGICATDPQIRFDGALFCFTGKSDRFTRNQIAEIIQKNGGIFNNNVNSKTEYLIVGNGGSQCWTFSCYGRKVEEALEMRKTGANIMIIHERDFWDCI